MNFANFMNIKISVLFQLHSLRRLMQGDEKHPKAPLGNNFRPPQPLHNRPIRTNIDFNVKKGTGQVILPLFFMRE